jgi:hypothetical protein
MTPIGPIDIAALEARIAEGLQNDHGWPFDGKTRGDAFAALDALVAEVERLTEAHDTLMAVAFALADEADHDGWRPPRGKDEIVDRALDVREERDRLRGEHRREEAP